MITPPRDIFRPSFVSTSSFGAIDPVTAALDFTSSLIDAVTGKASTRSSTVAAAAAQNPCAQRVQAQISLLGPKPVLAITKKQKDEKAKRQSLEAQLNRLLANPLLCPEVAAMQNPPPPVVAPTGPSPLTYLVGAVVLTSVIGGTVVLLRRKRK